MSDSDIRGSTHNLKHTRTNVIVPNDVVVVDSLHDVVFLHELDSVVLHSLLTTR